jgi:hypothetical protein
MTDLVTARQQVTEYLRQVEARMDSFGSALPRNTDRPKHQLAIVEEREFEFGWMFFYNTKKFAETGDHLYALGGNAPLIVDRTDGELYVTGTAEPLEHYLDEYRRGVRQRANQGTPTNPR